MPVRKTVLTLKRGHENMEIGQIIREWRKANGISQRELAERLRCGTHTVMGWENGINYPGFWALGVLADEMHCTVDYLMGRENHSAAACKESTMESMASEASEQRSTAD